MKNFIQNMLSGDSPISSKRTLGVLCILYYFIIFALTYFVEISDTQVTMSNQILFVGAGLLGVGIFEKKGETK